MISSELSLSRLVMGSSARASVQELFFSERRQFHAQDKGPVRTSKEDSLARRLENLKRVNSIKKKSIIDSGERRIKEWGQEDGIRPLSESELVKNYLERSPFAQRDSSEEALNKYIEVLERFTRRSGEKGARGRTSESADEPPRQPPGEESFRQDEFKSLLRLLQDSRSDPQERPYNRNPALYRRTFPAQRESKSAIDSSGVIYGSRHHSNQLHRAPRKETGKVNILSYYIEKNSNLQQSIEEAAQKKSFERNLKKELMEQRKLSRQTVEEREPLTPLIHAKTSLTMKRSSLPIEMCKRMNKTAKKTDRKESPPTTFENGDNYNRDSFFKKIRNYILSKK